jgi:hypothetical protein
MFAAAFILLAPTAAMASVAGGNLAGNTRSGAAAEWPQELEMALTGSAANDQQGLEGLKIILARGDQSGNGPGLGGQKGQKKGGHRGKQREGKDNPGRGRGNNRS